MSKTELMIDLNDGPPLVTIREAGNLLRCSRPTICRMIRDGRLTARKLGTSVRVDADSIRTLIGNAPKASYRAAA
jgi:excisionase family DNA binding protein